jgi:hypothetical protein
LHEVRKYRSAVLDVRVIDLLKDIQRMLV